MAQKMAPLKNIGEEFEFVVSAPTENKEIMTQLTHKKNVIKLIYQKEMSKQSIISLVSLLLI